LVIFRVVFIISLLYSVSLSGMLNRFRYVVFMPSKASEALFFRLQKDKNPNAMQH
jgi:hypothetical protein